MFCSKCGSKILEGALFCENCGARVAASIETPVSEPIPTAQPAAPNYGAAPVTVAKKTSGRGVIIAVISVALAAAVALGAWYFLFKDKDNKNDNSGNTPPVVEEITPEEVIEKTLEAVEDVESFSIRGETNSDYVFMDEQVKANTIIDGRVSVEDGDNYFKVDITSDGSTNSSEMYIEEGALGYNIYMYTADTWYKQEGIDESKIAQMGSGFDGLESLVFYMEKMEVNTMDEKVYKGKEVIILDGIIDAETSEEVLEKAGLMTLLDQLGEENARKIMTGLKPIKFKIIIDKETYLPVEYECDMTELTEAMYENIQELAAEEGEEISFEIYENIGIVTIDDYNSIEDIIIPDEAYEGTELQIVQ